MRHSALGAPPAGQLAGGLAPMALLPVSVTPRRVVCEPIGVLINSRPSAAATFKCRADGGKPAGTAASVIDPWLCRRMMCARHLCLAYMILGLVGWIARLGVWQEEVWQSQDRPIAQPGDERRCCWHHTTEAMLMQKGGCKPI